MKTTTHVVKLVVEAACIADGLAVVVPPPEGGVGGLAVCTDGALPPRGGLQHGGGRQKDISSEEVIRMPVTYQPSLWFDEGPILAIHFVVEPARVAEVVPVAITPPQWRRSGTTVDALASL